MTHRDHVGAANAGTEFLLQPFDDAEHVEGFRRQRTPTHSRRDQRTAGLELGHQPADPLLLIHLPVGGRHLEIAGQLIEGIAVARALLANVEAGQAEREGVHLGDQVVQRLTAQACALEALVDQLEIGAELVHGSVVQLRSRGSRHGALVPEVRLGRARFMGGIPSGSCLLLVAGQRQPQPLNDVADLEAIGLQPVAGRPLFVDLREAEAVHLEGFEQGSTDLAPLHRNAQLIAEVFHRRQVAIQHQLALVGGRPPSDIWSDRGVAVPVGSHPGAEGAEGVARGQDIGVVGAQGRANPLAQLGHRLKQHLLEVVQGVIHLVEDRRLELVQFVRAPPEADFFLELLAQVVALLRVQQLTLLQLLNQRGHTPLLVADGVANDLRGVGREHQTDVELLQELLDLSRRHPEAAQAGEQLPEGRGCGLARQGRHKGIAELFRVVGPQAGQIAVFLDVLLEDVDQLEIEGEGAGSGNRLREIHVSDQLDDPLGRRLRRLIRSPAVDAVAQFFHPQQAFRLGGGTFTAQHRLPEVFNQLQSIAQQARDPRLSRRSRGFSCGEGGPHRGGFGSGAVHDHPKVPVWGLVLRAPRRPSSCSRSAAAEAISSATDAPCPWAASHCIAWLPCARTGWSGASTSTSSS